MSLQSAQTQLINRISTVSATEDSLQQLAYAAKGLESLSLQYPSSPVGAYGLSWDESSDVYARVGSAANAVALPVQSQMRRCLLNDAGQVTAYLLGQDSRYLDNGTAAVLDGTAGQVMVEIPRFWYRYSKVGTKHTWEVSDVPATGFSVHPAFLKDGVEVPFRYIGAYEGYTAGGKLGSVSGQAPTTSQTRTVFRSQAAARGLGWRQCEWYLHHALQVLAIVEFGTFKLQDAIGAGRVNLSGGSWTGGSYIGITGKSNYLGNLTGHQSIGGAVTGAGQGDFVSYRGIENIWGNIYEFRDGLTVDASANDTTTPVSYWATNNRADFADTGSTNMTLVAANTNLGVTNAGYISALENAAYGFIGSAVAGSSTTKVPDYYYQYSNNGNGWRAPYVGGDANGGAVAGLFCLNVANPSSSSNVSVGSRAAF